MSSKRDFVTEFTGKVGTIAGGNGALVTIGCIALSTLCAPERVKEYGCPVGQLAILADWWPADHPSDPSTHVVFPSRYDGIPVYYKRGDDDIIAFGR